MLESTGLDLDPFAQPLPLPPQSGSPPLLLSPHCCCSGSLQEEKRAPLGRHLMRRPLATSSARELILEEAQAHTEQLEWQVNLDTQPLASALYAWRLAELAHPCRGDGPARSPSLSPLASPEVESLRFPTRTGARQSPGCASPAQPMGGRRNALRGAWLGPWPFAVQAGQVWMFVCQRVVRREGGGSINQSINRNQSINQSISTRPHGTHVRTRTHTHAQRPAASTLGCAPMPSCHISATARQ
ncbi:hypothetical protein J3F84DRAFT_202039 [Trichoderma pleuroticola]